ncbi:hypothetical protein AVEN_27158-1 [Araneus ventricosus]|uniref:Uncharacterized protein n=1 Tax=Araneus ventricosus TaxID=182803 RepID=A0A4Y2PY06_ARAVE|nr:hypothetical protein AVEN_27158-1 [Araneus ventricosus]
MEEHSIPSDMGVPLTEVKICICDLVSYLVFVLMGQTLAVGDANVTKNVDGTGGRLVCSVAHGHKVYYPSATKLSVTVWMGSIIPISGESRIHVGGGAEVIQFLHRRDECQTSWLM